MTGGRAAACALLGLAALLFAASVASGWSGAGRLAGREEDGRAARAAAAGFVSAYGTFDAGEPDGYAERLAALATGPLHDALAAAAVDPRSVEHQRSLSTRVEAPSVTALSGEEATVAVTAVQERRWSDPRTGQRLHERVRQHVTCRLIREDGRWLVAEVRLRSEEALPPDGGR